LTKGDPPADLSAEVAKSPGIDISSLGSGEWRLDSDLLSSIYDKLLQNGTSLARYTKDQILYGIKTGLNDAFVIDSVTRSNLIQEHDSSSQIIKPYLEGKDLRPWYVEAEDRWLIFTRRGTDIKRYPAIRRHLEQFRAQLTPRREGTDGPGRKPGSYDWFEIQDNVAYWEGFEQPKIVWPDIAKIPRFSMDYAKNYLGNTGYVIPLEDYFLLGVLASWPTWFMISRLCQPLRLRGGRWQYRLIRQFMERLPIPKDAKPADRHAIANLAKHCNELGPECYRLECEVLKRIKEELIPSEKKLPQVLQQWWECSFNDFKEQVELLRRQKMAGQDALSWEARLAKGKAARQGLRIQIEAAEADMSERVSRAFGLSQSEFKTVMDAVSS
jgi:hypothetical protein